MKHSELQALQNAANAIGLNIHEKHQHDKRVKVKKYFAQMGDETVSPLLDYEQLNHFLYGWINCQKKAVPSISVEDKQTELPEWCKQPESCGNSLSKKCICPKPESNKQPLYKVLNEKRTQGVLKCHKNLILDDLDEIGNWNFCGTNQNNINAQYATLAINNLHILAEALEKIIPWMQSLKDKGIFVPDSLADHYLQNGQQALTNIS